MGERVCVNVLGVDVDVIDTEGLYSRVLDFSHTSRPHKVLYFNAHCAVMSRRDDVYRRILNSADMVYPDGVSIVWAARLFHIRIPGRSTAADFMATFCSGFAAHGLKMYLLGATPGVAEEAASSLRREIPDLRIVGAHHGYFRKEETERVLTTIKDAGPDILLVGMGVPYQEKWIEEHYRDLDVPVIWGVGGLFDFLSGRLQRGPRWLLDNGFEWLCRFAIEPKRLWKRYILGNMQFSWLLLCQKMRMHR